jgi:chromosomal replication initiator protein
MDSYYDEEVAAQWMRVRSRLQAEFGEAAYRSWLKPLVLRSFQEGKIVIAVPTDFMREWVEAQYAQRLTDLWSEENRDVRVIKIVTQPTSVTQKFRQNREVPVPTRTKIPDQNGVGIDNLGAPLDKRLTFDTFVTGKPNELAFAAARRVAESSEVTFNPLFLYGGVGLGKTHLMHAIAWQITRQNPKRRIIYLSAEKFMYQFIRAIRYKDTVAFKEQFRSVDVLMIDDFQFISGKDSTQEEFFHTFNALVDQNRQIVISADKSPNDLEGIEERMRSRLGWGMVADLHPTTYELRLGILQSKAEPMGVEMPAKVLEFLAHKITSNVRELEGALNRIVAYASLVGRPITLESAQEVLHDLLRANDRRVTIEEIQKRVAEHFNIKLAEMSSARRSRAVARPRQVAMYLAKQLTARSLPEIGRKFGGRDHTTVMHAVRKVDELRNSDAVDELRNSDATFAEDVELLRRMLEG